MKRIFFFSLVLLLVQCKSGFQSSAYEIPEETLTVKIDPSENIQKRGDRTSISRMEVLGDFLSINVSYSGGCEEHEFELITDGRYSATYPPEIELVLRHDANNDRCRSYIDETLFFDLKPLQYDGTTRIVIRLTNNDNLYEYNY